MERTHEPLHLDKRNLVRWKIMVIIIINIFFDGASECGYGSKF
jgi:hypothetical protein